METKVIVLYLFIIILFLYKNKVFANIQYFHYASIGMFKKYVRSNISVPSLKHKGQILYTHEQQKYNYCTCRTGGETDVGDGDQIQYAGEIVRQIQYAGEMVRQIQESGEVVRHGINITTLYDMQKKK